MKKVFQYAAMSLVLATGPANAAEVITIDRANIEAFKPIGFTVYDLGPGRVGAIVGFEKRSV